jgi:hypothetical protein
LIEKTLDELVWAIVNIVNPIGDFVDAEEDKNSTVHLEHGFVKKITRLNYLMQGMEKEKYLKPHFSKHLKPLIKFLFHNSEYYNIPQAIQEAKEGIFKFPEDSEKPIFMP